MTYVIKNGNFSTGKGTQKTDVMINEDKVISAQDSLEDTKLLGEKVQVIDAENFVSEAILSWYSNDTLLAQDNKEVLVEEGKIILVDQDNQTKVIDTSKAVSETILDCYSH